MGRKRKEQDGWRKLVEAFGAIRQSQIFKSNAVRYIALASAAVAIIVVAIAPLTSAVVEGWSRRDVELRARLVLRSIRDQISAGITNESNTDLSPFFGRLAEDERLMALGLCNGEGRLLYTTEHFPSQISCANVTRSRTDAFTVFGNNSKRVHVSVFPISTNNGTAHLLVLHDLSYIDARVKEAHFYSIVALIGVILGLGLLSLALVLAMKRNWNRSISHAIKSINAGNAPTGMPRGLMSQEIRTLLSGLPSDQKFSDGIRVEWSPKTLHRLLEEELPDSQVLIVSNREPYIHNRTEGRIAIQIPASGLVAALEPVMRACGGTWIAHGSGSADVETVDNNDRIRVPPSDPAYILRRVWLSDQEQDGYYFGLANEGLWPLCHIAFVRPVFRESDWHQYKAVNQRFADVVVEEATREDPIVLVQDYHFALLPRMIRKSLPKATIITFWHIPWPNSETFGICPWRQEIIDGLLGSSILGFHTQFHCNNFLEAADRFMESRIDREVASIALGGHETLVRPYPISIEWPPAALANQAPTSACREAVKRRYGLPSSARITVGIERFDYTKGILDRLRAVDDLLTRQPEWRNKLVFIQAAAPTRGKLNVYGELQTEAVRLAEEINARHGTATYKPILLIIRHHEPQEVFELFRAADVCIVSSLHDGMNLVAKEFVASRDDEQGVLILSSFTGASRELSEAMIINPYDTNAMADIIGTALKMAPHEQRERMRLMRASVQRRNVYRWAAQMLFDAAQLRRQQRILAMTANEKLEQ